MSKLKRPNPVRFCPMAETDHMIFDVVRTLPSYADQFKYIKPLQRCLCNSVAHAEIRCDPEFCAPHLVEGLRWVKEKGDGPGPTGGVGKRIYRMYVDKDQEDKSKAEEDVMKLIRESLS